MILCSNNLSIFIENSYLYYVFENVLYIIYEIFFIFDVSENVYLINELI